MEFSILDCEGHSNDDDDPYDAFRVIDSQIVVVNNDLTEHQSTPKGLFTDFNLFSLS